MNFLTGALTLTFGPVGFFVGRYFSQAPSAAPSAAPAAAAAAAAAAPTLVENEEARLIAAYDTQRFIKDLETLTRYVEHQLRQLQEQFREAVRPAPQQPQLEDILVRWHFYQLVREHCIEIRKAAVIIYRTISRGRGNVLRDQYVESEQAYANLTRLVLELRTFYNNREKFAEPADYFLLATDKYIQALRQWQLA